MRLLTLPGVYRPDADSRMVAELLEVTTRPGERVLDVFTGSGVLAIAAARGGAGEVWAVDVSRRGVSCAALNARLNGVALRVRRGSLLRPVPGERFDTVVANPPYLPSVNPDATPRGAARAWEGGRDGRALLDPFLSQAPNHLRPGGRILVVHSSLCGIEQTVELLQARGLQVRVAAETVNPLGPLTAARADVLEQRGTLAPGDRTETIAVIEAAAAPAPTGRSGMQPGWGELTASRTDRSRQPRETGVKAGSIERLLVAPRPLRRAGRASIGGTP